MREREREREGVTGREKVCVCVWFVRVFCACACVCVCVCVSVYSRVSLYVFVFVARALFHGHYLSCVQHPFSIPLHPSFPSLFVSWIAFVFFLSLILFFLCINTLFLHAHLPTPSHFSCSLLICVSVTRYSFWFHTGAIKICHPWKRFGDGTYLVISPSPLYSCHRLAQRCRIRERLQNPL